MINLLTTAISAARAYFGNAGTTPLAITLKNAWAELDASNPMTYLLTGIALVIAVGSCVMYRQTRVKAL